VKALRGGEAAAGGETPTLTREGLYINRKQALFRLLFCP
jgi:hypothetical protein